MLRPNSGKLIRLGSTPFSRASSLVEVEEFGLHATAVRTISLSDEANLLMRFSEEFLCKAIVASKCSDKNSNPSG